ncbi:E3 ubiquitin-protein ligase Siah1-like [Bacillus rossius redtenbacheri]|uniref:E3 ubiquitin-protein ligase Siah1-like n=1 Tax=Bacillus rossius redtenbacheri TaxID=93214 RepID=UPI002FDCC7EA
MSSLLSVLKCQCGDYMSAPIRQCRNGHSVCSACVSEEPNCPTCGQNFIKARNYGLEEIAARVKLPCPYSSEGCRATTLSVDLDDHVDDCDYRSRRCGIRSCKWTGLPSSIIGHVKQKHPAQILNGGAALKIPKNWTSLPDNIWDVWLLKAFNRFFWVHLKLEGGNSKIMASVQNTISGFHKYELKLAVDNDSIAFCFETERSLVDMNSVFTKELCFSVSTKLAKNFIVDGCILLDVKIINP